MKRFFIFIFFISASYIQAQVTYTVTVPTGTNACFIAGDMTGWGLMQMTQVSSNVFTITISYATASQQYKYCSGPLWNFNEVTSIGGYVANRSYNANDVVVRWAALWDFTNNYPPTVSSGSIKRFWFTSTLVDNRYVDVWLPNGYSSALRYNVLYMHDGQMLFDKSTTWNGQEWNVDSIMGVLSSGGKIEPTIVVGISSNGNKRQAEYFPEKVIPAIPEPQKSNLESLFYGTTRGDAYLKFIVTELKPFIDSAFSTNPGFAHTYIAGSSMGGLISLYAYCEYPQIFSGAACLSTHWIGTFADNADIPNAIAAYVKQNIPPQKDRKIYFDHGTVGFDSYYGPYQLKIDSLFIAAGYTSSNFTSLIFQGADHNENAWQARFSIPAAFILSGTSLGITGNEERTTAYSYTAYPNPARNRVYILRPGETSEKQVTVYDVTGREVIHVRTTSGSVDISRLPAGMYFMHIVDTKTSIVKFIKY
jgi:predicted alpha/beta superfamily hydrolase